MPTLDPPGAVPPEMQAWGNSYSATHDILMILPGPKTQQAWVYDCASNVLRQFGPGPSASSATCTFILENF